MDIVKNFVDNIKKEDLHTLYVQIQQNGKIVDYWSRFSKLIRIESYSASKTFCAIGLGIALDQGIIRLDDIEKHLKVNSASKILKFWTLFIPKKAKPESEDDETPAIDEAADDAFCQKLYEDYLNDPERGETVTLEEVMKECGVSPDEL